MAPDEKLGLARKFLSVLSAPDEGVIRSIVADEMVWSFPGSSAISGEAHGIAGVMARAKAIAVHNVHVEIGRAVYGYNGLAIFLPRLGRAFSGRFHVPRQQDHTVGYVLIGRADGRNILWLKFFTAMEVNKLKATP